MGHVMTLSPRLRPSGKVGTCRGKMLSKSPLPRGEWRSRNSASASRHALGHDNGGCQEQGQRSLSESSRPAYGLSATQRPVKQTIRIRLWELSKQFASYTCVLPTGASEVILALTQDASIRARCRSPSSARAAIDVTAAIVSNKYVIVLMI